MPTPDYGTPEDKAWKPGDLALCIKGGHISGTTEIEHPKAGKVGEVEAVQEGVHFCNRTATSLRVSGQPLNLGTSNNTIRGWNARRFIKLPKDFEETKEDREVTEMLKNGVKTNA
jgi:hypothetical protein